jgi:isovaleryl-CoA dehydrogenase
MALDAGETRKTFQWDDPLDLSSRLSEDERMVGQAARAYAREKLLPRVVSAFAEERFDREIMTEMGQLGFLGPTLPEAYGGAAVNHVAYGLIAREIEAIDSGYRSAMSVQSSLVMYPIYEFGSEEQRRRWLPGMARGEIIGCFGLTEADGGSDPASMRTVAKPVDGGFLLNGAKMWITNAPEADTLVIYAKTDPAAGPRGISAFLVERGFKGFSTAQKLDKLGMRGSDTSEIVLQDCEVPAENLLGAAGQGVNILMSGLDYERAVLAAGPLGIMQACFDVVVPYLHERTQFGQPIGRFQLMQAKLADMYVSMNAAKAYVYAVAKSCDRGATTREDAAGAILYAAERATWMALEAIQCLGGNGYIQDYPTGRLLRDAKLYEIGAGTSEIRRMLIGREIFEKTA